MTKGADCHWRMNSYSGPLGKGQVLKVDALCTPDGRPVAVKPGPLISTCPRGGDELTTSRLFDQANREGRGGEGVGQLLNRGDQWGVCYNTDLGYVERGRNLGRDIPRLPDILQGMDCLHLYPSRPGSGCFQYDMVSDRVTFRTDIMDEVKILNSMY